MKYHSRQRCDKPAMAIMVPKPKKGSPLKLVPKDTGKDPAYLDAVRRLPCCICGRMPVEAHHVICGRFSRKKAPDRKAIPLCDGHHQGKWDTTELAIHKNKKAWVEAYGPDTDYITETQDAVKRMNNE